jgi:TonB family protein
MSSTGRRLNGTHSRVVQLSAFTAILIHICAFCVWPEYVPKIYRLPEEVLRVVELPPEIDVLPPPEEIPRPPLPIPVGTDDNLKDDDTIPPSDLDPWNLPPPPPMTSFDRGPYLPVPDRLPVLMHLEVPRYPEMARKADLEGAVRLLLTVDETGRVIDARVIKTTSEVFNQAAIDAAFRCRFEPALQADRPVRSRIVLPFRFSLRD